MTFQSPKPTWRELFDMGLYATEAARMRGSSKPDAAIQWARRNGLRWPDGRDPKFQAQRANYCPVVIRGKHYPSISHAARALGLCESTIISHLNRYGHADKAGLRGRGRNPTKSHNAKPVSVAGVNYSSLAAAAKDLHIGIATLRDHRNGELDQKGQDRLLSAILRRDARQANARMKEATA